MEYFISFLEGIITFISPCLLPMLPIYIVYFAGGSSEGKEKRAIKNAMGFVLGFTMVFVSLGALAASLGRILQQHQIIVNFITGTIVIVFGLNFMGVIKIGFLNATKKLETEAKPMGFFSSVIFGIVFSIGWTPCVGAFLGSALMLASQQGSVFKGIGMLLAYSLGLGIPFVVSAVLIDRLKNMFGFIKQNYKTVNMVCGSILVLVGFLMVTGLMGRLLRLLSF